MPDAPGLSCARRENTVLTSEMALGDSRVAPYAKKACRKSKNLNVLMWREIPRHADAVEARFGKPKAMVQHREYAQDIRAHARTTVTHPTTRRANACARRTSRPAAACRTIRVKAVCPQGIGRNARRIRAANRRAHEKSRACPTQTRCQIVPRNAKAVGQIKIYPIPGTAPKKWINV